MSSIKIIKDNWLLIIALFTIQIAVAQLNQKRHKNYFAEINYNDDFVKNGQTNKREINYNKDGYVNTVKVFLIMKTKWSIPKGILSTPSTLLIWYSLRKLNTSNPIEAFEDVSLIFNGYYEKYKANFNVLNNLYPLWYFAIHFKF